MSSRPPQGSSYKVRQGVAATWTTTEALDELGPQTAAFYSQLPGLLGPLILLFSTLSDAKGGLRLLAHLTLFVLGSLGVLHGLAGHVQRAARAQKPLFEWRPRPLVAVALVVGLAAVPACLLWFDLYVQQFMLGSAWLMMALTVVRYAQARRADRSQAWQSQGGVGTL